MKYSFSCLDLVLYYGMSCEHIQPREAAAKLGSGSRFVQFEVPFLSSALGDTEASDMRSSSWSGDPDDVETGSFELPDSGNPELFLYSG